MLATQQAGEIIGSVVSARALLALAVWRSMRDSPASFGSVEMTAAEYERQLAALTVARDAALQAIGESWTAQDVDIHPVGGDLFRLTFRGTDISVSDPARLVAHAAISR